MNKQIVSISVAISVFALYVWALYQVAYDATHEDGLFRYDAKQNDWKWNGFKKS